MAFLLLTDTNILYIIKVTVGCETNDYIAAKYSVIGIAGFSKIDTKKARLYRSSNSNRLSEHI